MQKGPHEIKLAINYILEIIINLQHLTAGFIKRCSNFYANVPQNKREYK